MDDLELEQLYGQIFEAEDLCEAGAYDNAIQLCDGVLREWADSDDADAFEAIAAALHCRGRSLGGLGRFEEELRAYEDIVGRFESQESDTTLMFVSEARFNAAVATGEMGLIDESIRRYTAFIDRYQAYTEPNIQEQVMRAHYNRAVTLKFSDRGEEALARFGELVSRYGESEEPEYEATVVRSLISKAALEASLGQHRAAIESATSGIERCDERLVEERVHCHLIMAAAHLLSNDKVSGEKQVVVLLELLPAVQSLAVAEHLKLILHPVAGIIGLDRTLELVRNSPAAEILAADVQTLQASLSRESDRLQGIEEMAKSIATDLAWIDRPSQ